VLLDTQATKDSRLISLDLLNDIASEAKMPFAVGGGINSLKDIRSILSMGAEKVVISSEALVNPGFLREAADQFGSSSIMVCMDVKTSILGKKQVQISSNGTKLSLLPMEAAKLVEENGAGELILQSVDRDGVMEGYDEVLINEISDALSIPVIALGGAGTLQHMKDLYKSSNVSALASGSTFVFQDKERGVLVNYPSTEELNNASDWLKD
tara:strand:+ start:492 stop:1124 length:633 start_codon:yes stop_codon:yes gene_type:complete